MVGESQVEAGWSYTAQSKISYDASVYTICVQPATLYWKCMYE